MDEDEAKEPWLRAIIARLKEAPPASDPEAEARVMARVRAQAASGVSRPSRPAIFDWLLRPRTITTSPLALCASGLALVLIVLAGAGLLRHPNPPPASISARGAVELHPALFTVLEPKASRISIVGDFNNWDPAANPLQSKGEGVWAGVIMLRSGVYAYAYAVDGRIQVISDTRPAVAADDFGVGRSILVVGKDPI
jgi:hypothetical protein